MANFGTPVRITGTGAVSLIGMRLLGVLCNASSSGTLTIYDALSATGTVVANALPVVAGAYTPIPAACNVGIWVVIGGTADVTFFVH